MEIVEVIEKITDILLGLSASSFLIYAIIKIEKLSIEELIESDKNVK